MKQYVIALIALSFIACQAIDPRLLAASQKQETRTSTQDTSPVQQPQSTTSMSLQDFQKELSKAEQAHPKVINLLLTIHQTAHQEYNKTAALIESLPDKIKELPTEQELLQEINDLKELQKKLETNPNAAVQEEIDKIKEQIDDLGILLSAVGVMLAVTTHFTTYDMYTSIKDSYVGQIGQRCFDEYIYKHILEHPAIKQYAARRTVGNFTFETSLSNLLYGSISGIKNQPLALTDDYASTWASICLAEQIRTGIYYNKNSPRKIPGTDIIAFQDNQVVRAAVNGAADLVTNYAKKTPSLSAFAQKSGAYLLHEATYNAAVQLAYALAQAQGIQPELINAFLPKDCLARTPTQLAVKSAFNLLLPAAFADKNLDVLLTTGLLTAQTATSNLNYVTLNLPSNITLLKDNQCIDACLETGKTLIQQYTQAYDTQAYAQMPTDILSTANMLQCNGGTNCDTNNIQRNGIINGAAKDMGVNMATYMVYNLTSQLLHNIAEHSDLIDKELLETLFPKNLDATTAPQLITKLFFRKGILQHGIPMAIHVTQAAFEQIKLARAAAAQLPDVDPRALWALKHPVIVNGALFAAQGVTSNINPGNPIKLPGTDAVLLTQGQVVDAGLKAGAEVATTKDNRLLSLFAKNLATQATYNGTTQLIHKVAQCGGIDEKHVERFFPKDCNATTWTQRITALLCKYGITHASTTLATTIGAALVSNVNFTGIV